MFKYLTLLVLIATGPLHVSANDCRKADVKTGGVFIERCISLDLSNGGIGANGVKEIAESFMGNTTYQLKFLRLSTNKIGDTGAESVADILKKSPQLTELYVTNNKIGNTGAIAIVEALKNSEKLEILGLNRNEIKDYGAIAIAKALKDNNSIKELFIEENKIGKTGAIAIAEALKDNNTLKDLNLLKNDIEEDGTKALDDLKKFKHKQGYRISISYDD